MPRTPSEYRITIRTPAPAPFPTDRTRRLRPIPRVRYFPETRPYRRYQAPATVDQIINEALDLAARREYRYPSQAYNHGRACLYFANQP